MGLGGQWSEVTLLFAAQKPFVCPREAPKQTLCSLSTSDVIYMASNSVLSAVQSPVPWKLVKPTISRLNKALSEKFSFPLKS